MILRDLELRYDKGERSYEQRIKGKKNYIHTEKNKRYNGCGGVENFYGSVLNMYGTNENGDVVAINIKREILETFQREKLREKFVIKLQKALPESLEVEFGGGKWKLTADSCRTIFRNIHPRKKFNI